MSEQQYARLSDVVETLKTFPDKVVDQLKIFSVMYDLARWHILAETQAHAQEKEEQDQQPPA